MTTIKTREYLFRRKPRHGRNLLAVCLLASGALAVATLTDSADVLAEADAPAARLYAAVGGAERLVFEPTEAGALVRFVCLEGVRACDQGPMMRLDRVATPKGDALYRDAAGVPVLRVAQSGAARLLPGSAGVPSGLPRAGRTLLPTEGGA